MVTVTLQGPCAQGASKDARVAALARRADVLEALERFAEAASDLREALSHDPANKLVSLVRPGCPWVMVS